MPGHGVFEWDDEQWGDAEPVRRRTWHRRWNPYVASTVGFIGLIMAIGSIAAPGWHTVGAVLVMLTPLAISRSDGPRRRPRTPQPPPAPPRVEATWLAVAVAMVAVGFWLFTR